MFVEESGTLEKLRCAPPLFFLKWIERAMLHLVNLLNGSLETALDVALLFYLSTSIHSSSLLLVTTEQFSIRLSPLQGNFPVNKSGTVVGSLLSPW